MTLEADPPSLNRILLVDDNAANLEIDAATAQFNDMARQIELLNQQL